jgi:glycosyltransferase involved in cell wall biosynthesis
MFVTNSLSGGGAERATNILVNALHDSGIKVALVPINDGVRDLVEPKCEIFELKRQWQGGIFTLFSAFFSLQRTIRRWKPTIIVLNCDLPELLGSLSIGSHKLIAVEHATFPWTNRIQLGKIVRMLLEFRRVRWVSVSDHLSIWQSKQIASVIKNAVISQPEFIEKRSIQVERLNFVGRLSAEKQPSWLVEIAKKTNLPARIIGDGILMEDLQEACKELNNLVEFLGYVSDPWEYFEDSDLLIVPSAFEGDGLVVVEALMRGIPILLSDIPDLRRFELPEINYGKSIDDFSRTILQNLVSIDKLKVSGDIVKNITSNRDPRIVAEQWTKLLKELRQIA